MIGMFSKDRAVPGRLAASALLLAPLLLAVPAGAQTTRACDMFQGKTVELVIPFAAGGGFDVYGRLVAKYMGPELGAANMIVRNQPGAGGLLATNQTWAAKPDGLRIQMIAVSGMVAAEFGGATGVAFRTNDFSWIGRITGEPDVIATGPDGRIRGLDEVRAIGAQRKVRIGSTGLGSPQYISARLLQRFVGTEADVITGFSSAPEVYASLGRGELDLFASSLTAADAATKAGTARALWVFGTAPLAGAQPLKPLSDIVDPRFRPLIEVHASVIGAGRALAAPPGLPAERLQCLRDAFERTAAGAGFLDEARRLNRPVEPLSGRELADLVKSATDGAPAEYLDLLRESFAQ